MAFRGPEATDSLGRTRLFNAACTGRVEFVQMLLEAGDSIATRDKFRNTPVHGAAYGGSVSAMKLIVEAGGDLSSRTREGLTPLMIAAQKVKRRACTAAVCTAFLAACVQAGCARKDRET